MHLPSYIHEIHEIYEYMNTVPAANLLLGIRMSMPGLVSIKPPDHKRWAQADLVLLWYMWYAGSFTLHGSE